MLLKTTSTLALVFMSVALSTGTANADHLRHIDEMAVAVRNDAARIANEIRYHFRGSHNYQHLYRDAYETYQLADHIHEVSHSGDLAHLREDVDQLDEMFHHLEDMVATVNAEYGARPVYEYGDDYGYGTPIVTGGYHTYRLNRLMSSMSANVHHMQEDVDSLLGPAVVPEAPVAAPIAPSMPAVPVPSPGPVIHAPGTAHLDFGEGSSRVGITFRIR